MGYNQDLNIHFRQDIDAFYQLEIQIYDPNHPLRDDVIIKSEFVLIEKEDPLAPPVFGLKSEQWIGDRKKKNVRGFFAMPYTPVIPPQNL